MNNRMTPAGLRTRFAELNARREAILTASTPLRQARDAIVADARARTAPLEAQVRDIEADLFEIEQERALIARALGPRLTDA